MSAIHTMKQGTEGLRMAGPALYADWDFADVDIVFPENERNITLVHTRPLEERASWVEYDAAAGTITLMMESGGMKRYGEKLKSKWMQMIADRDQALFMELDMTGRIKELYVTPLVNSEGSR